MTVDHLWTVCERLRKQGHGFQPVRVYKRDGDRGALLWGPYAIGVFYVDTDGNLTLEATEPCPHCGKPA